MTDPDVIQIGSQLLRVLSVSQGLLITRESPDVHRGDCREREIPRVPLYISIVSQIPRSRWESAS